MAGTDTYTLKELATLLAWNPAHCKVILKQLGAYPAGQIDNETAAKVADKVHRLWPPKAAELAPLQRLAAPEAFQIKRKQFLILAQAAQQHVAAASLQTDASQPEPARRVPIGPGRQPWREAATHLAIERAPMPG